MMFGVWGATPPRPSAPASTPPSTPASRPSTPPTSTPSAEAEEIVGRALRTGATGDAGHQVREPDVRGPGPAGRRRGAGSPRPSRTACAGSAPTGSTSTSCTDPTRDRLDETLATLGDLVDRARSGLRHVDLPGVDARRGGVRRRSATASGRSPPSSRRTPSSRGGSRPRCFRCVEHLGWACWCCGTARRRRLTGKYQGAARTPADSRAVSAPRSTSTSGAPPIQDRKHGRRRASCRSLAGEAGV